LVILLSQVREIILIFVTVLLPAPDAVSWHFGVALHARWLKIYAPDKIRKLHVQTRS
jgi:hypothetical protein